MGENLSHLGGVEPLLPHIERNQLRRLRHLYNVIFSSSKHTNTYPITLTGNLRENNCTSLFSNLSQSHSETYFFRIENKPFRATAECEGLQITVKDSPWRPTINISGDLKENERVTVTCSAVTPCPHSPPELTWNLQQDFHTQTEENNDGTFTTKIQKNITLSDTHDGYNISCSVRYPVNEGKHFKTSQTEKTLSVSYAPKDTSASISPSGLVSAGSWVKLTCSSRANPPVSSFTWFKKSEDGDMKVAEGDFYILNVTVGGVYYCVATNDVGKQTSADICLNGVWAACPGPVNLHITTPEKMEALEGSCLQIPCKYSTIDGENDKFDKNRTIYGIWMKNNHDLKKQDNVIFNSSKQTNTYPITLTGNLRENNCTSLFSNLSQSHSETYFFRIENEPFRATAECESLQITVKDSPWRPTINISGDLKENERVTITCSAVTPCPHSPPELTWNLQQDFHTQTEKNNDGTFTTKIQKNITLSDTHDGYNINCSVRYPVNEGKDFKTSQTEKTLSVSYAPKDTSASISPSGLVSAGSWVKLTCSSRANPPVSNFTWFKKSEDGDMKVAEGDFYILNVTVGGVYYCVATNDVGNQTSADISLNVWKIIGGIVAIIFLVGSVCQYCRLVFPDPRLLLLIQAQVNHMV
ncbi:vascular cell adhesion protein 1-like [Xenentodon cancila]